MLEARSRAGIDLTRVRSPQDAIAFVAKFGLLNQPGIFDWEAPPSELRQPFAEFERAAAISAGLLTL